MKKNQVTIGNVYTAKVSGKLARVRITGESPHGGWVGLNIDTKRKVRVKTAGRLQRQIADPDAPAAASKPEPEAAPKTIPAEQEMPEAREQRAAGNEPTSEDKQAQEQEADEEPQAAPEAAQAADTPPEQPTPDQGQESTADAPSGAETLQDAPADAPQEQPLTKLTVEELRAQFIEVPGRVTSSTSTPDLL